MALAIQYQAAMGLGILLFELGKILLFLVFPVVWGATTFRAINTDKKNGYVLTRRDYAYAVLKGFVSGITTLLVIAIVVFLLLYFFVDLSVS